MQSKRANLRRVRRSLAARRMNMARIHFLKVNMPTLRVALYYRSHCHHSHWSSCWKNSSNQNLSNQNEQKPALLASLFFASLFLASFFSSSLFFALLISSALSKLRASLESQHRNLLGSQYWPAKQPMVYRKQPHFWRSYSKKAKFKIRLMCKFFIFIKKSENETCRHEADFAPNSDFFSQNKLHKSSRFEAVFAHKRFIDA